MLVFWDTKRHKSQRMKKKATYRPSAVYILRIYYERVYWNFQSNRPTLKSYQFNSSSRYVYFEDRGLS